MSKVTSFIGEHTVELTIVPMFKKILEEEFEFVVPIFPWMTREGGIISQLVHKNDEFKIIGLYPRRPKLSTKEADSIFIKISEQIILGARSGQVQGIPIIGGLPLVRNFWELSNNPECLWLNLDFEKGAKLEYQIKFENSFKPEKPLSEKVLTSYNEIHQLINKKSRIFDINNAIEAFRKIKMESMNLDFYSRFAYMGGYKPIYFLLK
ncbi:hypothetical protein [Cyclobacterium roseum]|uniref:hypothetical protein n=1 Tax=Cyclobacterium roseum TaxID=2666137 RepID=UPI001391EB25|nr:hypothetical protein [Cyclobacterium roseum]